MKNSYAAVAPQDDGLAGFESYGVDDPPGPPASERLLIGLGRRVAELRQMNLELRDALGALQDRYEVGVDRYEFAPVACCGLDRAGIITDINVAGASLLGSTVAAIVGRPLASFATPDDDRAVREHVRACVADRVRTRTRVRVVGDGGSPVPVQMISGPARSALGGSHLVTVIVEDSASSG
jgi:PAS domain S-box-containing protein